MIDNVALIRCDSKSVELRKQIHDQQSKFNDINPLMGVADKEPFNG